MDCSRSRYNGLVVRGVQDGVWKKSVIQIKEKDFLITLNMPVLTRGIEGFSDI